MDTARKINKNRYNPFSTGTGLQYRHDIRFLFVAIAMSSTCIKGYYGWI